MIKTLHFLALKYQFCYLSKFFCINIFEKIMHLAFLRNSFNIFLPIDFFSFRFILSFHCHPNVTMTKSEALPLLKYSGHLDLNSFSL